MIRKKCLTLKIKIQFVWVAIALSILFFPTISGSKTTHNLNEFPMYGGIEKSHRQKLADAAFIKAAIEKYGTKEIASNIYVNYGWHHFGKGDFRSSMKRFNQAWLLNHQNFNAFWGFGSVLLKQKKFDKTIVMFSRALEFAQDNGKLIIDTAQAYTGKAADGSISKVEANECLEKAVKLYRQAQQMSPNYGILYSQWAITLFYQGKYYEAWEKISRSRALNGANSIPSGFIEELKLRLPDPYQK